MSAQDLLNSLIPVLGKKAVEMLSDQLNELAQEEDEAYRALLLGLIADAVDEHGPSGVEIAQQTVEDLFAGKTPDIDWASPRIASDLVAQMQNAEAGRQARTRDFFVKLGDALALILIGVIKGMATS